MALRLRNIADAVRGAAERYFAPAPQVRGRDVVRELAPTTGRFLRGVGSVGKDIVKGTRAFYGETVPQAIAAPYYLRQQQEAFRQKTALVNNLLAKAKATPDPTRRRKLLTLAQQTAAFEPFDITRDLPSVKKTTKQVIGEAAELPTLVAPFSAPFKAAYAGGLLTRAAAGALPTAGALAARAAQENKSKQEIIKAARTGALLGGGIAAAAPYVVGALKTPVGRLPEYAKSLPGRLRADVAGQPIGMGIRKVSGKDKGSFNYPSGDVGKVEKVSIDKIKIERDFADMPPGAGSEGQPPVLRKLKDGTYEVFDGMHRLARAAQQGEKSVQALIVNPDTRQADAALRQNVMRAIKGEQAIAESGMTTQTKGPFLGEKTGRLRTEDFGSLGELQQREVGGRVSRTELEEIVARTREAPSAITPPPAPPGRPPVGPTNGQPFLPDFDDADDIAMQRPGAWQKVKAAAKHVGLWSRDILKQEGETGRNIANRIDTMYDDAERYAGTLTFRMKQATGSLPKQSIENVSRALDGQPVVLSPQESAAASAIREQLDDVARNAQVSQLEIRLPSGDKVPFQPRENYFPHLLDYSKLAENRQNVIQYLVKTGQVQSQEQAVGFVDDLIKGKPPTVAYMRNFRPQTPVRFGNLEMARIFDWPKEVLRYDREVLGDYFAQATKRITQAQQFGPNNELVPDLLQRVADEGGDPRTVEYIMRQNLTVMRDNPTVAQGLSVIRRMQGLMKLGRAAISNAGQSSNTATEFGIRDTVREIFKSRSPQSQELALRSGAILDDSLKQLERELGREGITRKLTAPGFSAVEKFNRVVAANAGKDFALRKFQEAAAGSQEAVDDLAKIGVNPIKALERGYLNDDDILRAAQRAVNWTQFKVRPIDLPPAWSTTTGKLVTQFRNFTMRHAEFFAKRVVAPAIYERNFGPLVRFAVLTQVVGEAIGDIKAAISFRERPKGITRVLDNFAQLGGAGIAGDALTAASRGPDAVLSWIAGPTIGDIATLAGSAGLAARGKPKTLTRFVIRNLPIVGQSIANIVVPPRGAYQVRTPDVPLDVLGLEPIAPGRPGAISPVPGFPTSEGFSPFRPTQPPTLPRIQGVRPISSSRGGGGRSARARVRIASVPKPRSVGRVRIAKPPKMPKYRITPSPTPDIEKYLAQARANRSTLRT